MILEKNKAYIINKNVVVLGCRQFLAIILGMSSLAFALTMLSVVIIDYNKEVSAKKPFEIRSEEVVHLCDLLVEHKISNGNIIRGLPGNWKIVKGDETYHLE